jgi:hypothetical protein
MTAVGKAAIPNRTPKRTAFSALTAASGIRSRKKAVLRCVTIAVVLFREVKTLDSERYLNAGEAGKVVRCTESNGRVVEFAYTKPADVWVRMYASEETGHISSEESVRNAVKLCNPDVEIVDEDVSLFAAARKSDDKQVVGE